VRLLVKNLGRVMPKSVVREELELLDIHVQGVTQLRSGRRDQDPAKHRPPPLLQRVGGARARAVKGACTHQTLWLASVGGNVRGYKRPVAMQALTALRTYAAKLRIRTPVRSVWGLPTFRWVFYSAGTASVLWLRGKTHGELPWALNGRNRGQRLQSRRPSLAERVPP
jgi:hypothetical protein